MDSVQRWSGKEARALREALRMSVRTFAERLGAAHRTVTRWESLGVATHPYPEMQAALDTLLRRATEEECERFRRVLDDPPEAARRTSAEPWDDSDPGRHVYGLRSAHAPTLTQTGRRIMVSAPRRQFGAALARLRHDAGFGTQAAWALALNAATGAALTREDVSRWERGTRIPDAWLPTIAQTLHQDPRELAARARAARDGVPFESAERFRTSPEQGVSRPLSTGRDVTEREPSSPGEAGGLAGPDVSSTETLRRSINDALSVGTVGEFTLDDWDDAVDRFGLATRYRPAGILSLDLSTDLSELGRLLGQRQSATSLRRLMRVTAQLGGLMSLTLLKLEDRAGARNWARTARVAAKEAGSPDVESWVLAQEAYADFYGDALQEAVLVARKAQAVAGRKQGVGAALAASLEARALAALGSAQEARQALHLGESILSNLSESEQAPSAFAYNEAQFRFHEGNTFTHMGDTDAAWISQDRAFELYPANDYMDRALIELDRSRCLMVEGDVSAAASLAVRTLTRLTREEREGLIRNRAWEVFSEFGSQGVALPAVRDLREVLIADC